MSGLEGRNIVSKIEGQEVLIFLLNSSTLYTGTAIGQAVFGTIYLKEQFHRICSQIGGAEILNGWLWEGTILQLYVLLAGSELV